ncbi:hypothetical protein [Actinomyces sp. 432]|nr:hypothetical protein [Actinomyces sp. 432]
MSESDVSVGRERPLSDEEAAELMARLTERAAYDPANDTTTGGGDAA